MAKKLHTPLGMYYRVKHLAEGFASSRKEAVKSLADNAAEGLSREVEKRSLTGAEKAYAEEISVTVVENAGGRVTYVIGVPEDSAMSQEEANQIARRMEFGNSELPARPIHRVVMRRVKNEVGL